MICVRCLSLVTQTHNGFFPKIIAKYKTSVMKKIQETIKHRCQEKHSYENSKINKPTKNLTVGRENDMLQWTN